MRLFLFFLLPLLFLVNTTQAQEGQGLPAGSEYVREIAELASLPALKDAFEHVDALEPVTRDNLIAITEIPAPPFQETARALAYEKMLKDRGTDSVWIDSVGNVLALRKGVDGTGKVALNAHLDTVFPEGTEVGVRMEGDTLYAPGIGDDSRGLAMILTILDALDAAEVQTQKDLLLVATVGEEGLGDLRGVKYLFRPEGPEIASWISIDGGQLPNITSMALGSVRYRITFQGPGGHSWGAFGLGNPHHAAARAISTFVREANTFVSSGPKTSFNVGRTGGGTSVNAIPFESWMEIDMRSESPARLRGIEELLLRSFRDALAGYNSEITQGPALTMKAEKIGDRPSGETLESSPLVQRALAATAYFNIKPQLGRSSTDSNIPISKGIPALTLGRGGQGGGTHSLNEWWLNDETGPVAIKRALLLVLAETGLVK